MTLIIIAILFLAYILIATERITNVNKAAVAIFAGTVGWVLYICWGTDYVMSQHQGEYVDWLNGAIATSTAVKQYIAENIFLRYVGRSSEILLFLLSTMTIVEILNNNGCFDYFSIWTRTRNSKKFLWLTAIITLLLSANLDSLTTTIMMLVIMIKNVRQHRQRLVYGAAIVLSANYGGAMTVIGDPTGLVLWNMEAVTASGLFLALVLPCLAAWATTMLLLSGMLPERIDLYEREIIYRGDDTNLNNIQRIIMLIVSAVDCQRDIQPQAHERRQDDTAAHAESIAVRSHTDDALRHGHNARTRSSKRDRSSNMALRKAYRLCRQRLGNGNGSSPHEHRRRQFRHSHNILLFPRRLHIGRSTAIY